jgi:hypothetical protein
MVEFLYTSNYEAKHEPDLVPHRITWKVPTLNNMEKAKARQIAEMVAILKPESYKDIAATVVAMSPIWYVPFLHVVFALLTNTYRRQGFPMPKSL